jgi:hypothetical protein
MDQGYDVQKFLKSKHWILKTLIVIISVTGFLSQVTQMSALYFKYLTTTQVNFVLNKYIVHHSLVLCVRYTDILDRKRLAQETGIIIKYVKDVSDAVNVQSKLTVKQMFEYTPKADEIISGCFLRPSDWTFLTVSNSSCSTYFTVTRYMTQEFMCYTFEPIRSKKLKTDAATLSHFKQFTVYDVALAEIFRKADHVIPITFVGRYPYVSRSFTDALILVKDNMTPEYNLINISPNDYSIRLLEKPYVDACINKRPDLYHECRRECLMSLFEDHEKIPVTEFLPEDMQSVLNYDLPPITTFDLEDPEVEENVRWMYKECHDKCYFNPCLMLYTKTTIRTLVFKDFPLILASMTPTEADVKSESQATMSFVEYFSFICGCFGTWFGVSFFSLHRVYQMMNEKRKRKKWTRVTHTEEFFADYVPSWKRGKR